MLFASPGDGGGTTSTTGRVNKYVGEKKSKKIPHSFRHSHRRGQGQKEVEPSKVPVIDLSGELQGSYMYERFPFSASGGVGVPRLCGTRSESGSCEPIHCKPKTNPVESAVFLAYYPHISSNQKSSLDHYYQWPLRRMVSFFTVLSSPTINQSQIPVRYRLNSLSMYQMIYIHPTTNLRN